MRAVVFVLLLVPACSALTTTALPDRAVDEGFTATGMSWQSGRRMYFSLATLEDNGKVAVCGSVSREPGGDSNDTRFDEWWINTAKVVLEGDTVLNSLGFFKESRFVEGKAPGGNAGCVRTACDWEDRFAEATPQIVSTRSSFSLRD